MSIIHIYLDWSPTSKELILRDSSNTIRSQGVNSVEFSTVSKTTAGTVLTITPNKAAGGITLYAYAQPSPMVSTHTHWGVVEMDTPKIYLSDFQKDYVALKGASFGIDSFAFDKNGTLQWSETIVIHVLNSVYWTPGTIQVNASPPEGNPPCAFITSTISDYKSCYPRLATLEAKDTSTGTIIPLASFPFCQDSIHTIWEVDGSLCGKTYEIIAKWTFSPNTDEDNDCTITKTTTLVLPENPVVHNKLNIVTGNGTIKSGFVYIATGSGLVQAKSVYVSDGTKWRLSKQNNFN